jgi:RNA polymerase sigma factor (sigma-70 family)
MSTGENPKSARYFTKSENGVEVFASGEHDSVCSAALDALNNYFESERWHKQAEAPYPHQETVFADIIDFFESGRKRGYVELPTNTGKTYIMSKLADAFHAADMRALILAPTLPIAKQIAEDPERGLMRFAPTVTSSGVGRHFEHSRATKDDSVVVSTYASLNNFTYSKELGEFDIILADEAHHSLGDVTKQNLIAFSPDAIKIGLTATPYYAADKRVDEVFDDVIHSVKLREAIENRLVAPVQVLIYSTEAEIPYLDPRFRDFTQNELEKLAHLKSRNEQAVAFGKNFVADGRQGIIACLPGGNLAHPKSIAHELNGQEVWQKDGSKKTIRAKAVGGSIQDREATLRAFERGDVDILTFVYLIAEGWDSKRASFLIDLCPTTSILKKTQLAGRVLRFKPDNRESIIVDFLDHSLGKLQATTLAVLEEESFELGSAYSAVNDERGYVQRNRSYLRGMLDQELWSNVLASDTKLVSELICREATIRRSKEERLMAQFERQLRDEGMGTDVPDNMGLPKTTMQGIQRYINSHARQYSIMPDLQEIEGFIDGKKVFRDPVEARRVARLAVNGFSPELRGIHFSELTEDIDAVEDPTFELANAKVRQEQLGRLMSCLPDRESRIIMGRYVDELSLRDVGREVDLSAQRVSQLERQAMTRLTGLATAYKSGDTVGIDEKVRMAWIDMAKQDVDTIAKRMHNIKIETVKLGLTRPLEAPDSQASEVWREKWEDRKLEYYAFEFIDLLTKVHIRQLQNGERTSDVRFIDDASNLSDYLRDELRRFKGTGVHLASQAMKELYLFTKSDLSDRLPFDSFFGYDIWLQGQIWRTADSLDEKEWMDTHATK